MTRGNKKRPKQNRANSAVLHGPSLLTDQDIYLFKEGTHFRLYDKLGAHPLTVEGREGIHFKPIKRRLSFEDASN